MTDLETNIGQPGSGSAWSFGRRRPRVAVVRLEGVIGSSANLGGVRRRLNLRGMARILDKAFSLPRTQAVALAINCPGGSPVQSALIAGRIRSLAEQRHKPVIAFAEDVAASGGYWLACAADEIFAAPSSIVGSIGVVTAGFGLVEMLEKAGIERRLHRSGEHKGMLDPFLPEDPADIERLAAIQRDIHDEFKKAVAERRGRRLKADEEVLFSGEFWTGNRGLELGLIDGIGEMRAVMRERFGERVRFVEVTERRAWWPRRLGFGGWPVESDAVSEGVADRLAGSMLAAVEDRVWWNRYGL